MKITTVSELRSAYCEKHPDGHFFDADTLKFFGERFSEIRLLKKKETITDYLGKEHSCYVLSSVQRRPMGRPRRTYHYFDEATLENIDS